MKHAAAYLLCVLGGNENPSADDVTKALSAVGVEADSDSLSKLMSELEGKDLAEVLASGKEMLAKFGAKTNLDMEAASGRKYIIGGNWKCNGTIQSVNDLINNVLNKATFDQSQVEVVVAPVSFHISTVKAQVNDNIKVCSQNIGQFGKGAFTGEVSGDQLKDFGIEWTLIGHSERRNLYGETDAIVAAKTAQAQEIGLNTIICIGEKLEDREGGTTNQVLATQLNGFKDSVKDWSKIVIAYEPVWAIGTGKTATPEMAQETHAFIRQWLTENVSQEVSDATRI